MLSSYSGLMAFHSVPVAADQKYLPVFQVKVVDKDPVWFHCEQTGHCGAGMHRKPIVKSSILLTFNVNRDGVRYQSSSRYV